MKTWIGLVTVVGVVGVAACASTSKPVVQVSHGGREASLQLSRDSRSLLSQMPTEDALKSREELVERDDKSAAMLVSIAELSLLGNRPDEAAIQARDLLKKDFKNVAALKTLIKVSIFSRRYNEALLEVENGLQMAPKDPDLLCLKGLTYYFMDDVFSARDAWKKALEANPHHVTAQMNMATLHFHNRNLALAGTGFERVLAQQPGNLDAQTGKALVLDAQGSYEDARRILQGILAVNARSPLVLYNLAVIERDRFENYEKALEYMDDYLQEAQRERTSVERAIAQREELRVLVAKQKSRKLSDDEIRQLAKRSSQAVQADASRPQEIQDARPVPTPTPAPKAPSASESKPKSATPASAPAAPVRTPPPADTVESLEDAIK